MAGLLDSFKSPEEVRKELMARQEQQLQSNIKGAGSRREKGIHQILAGLSQAGSSGMFGEGVKESLTSFEGDPSMRAAQNKAALAKQVSELQSQPGTSEHMFQVAKLAKDSGDDVMAVNVMMQAGRLQQAEGVAAAKAETAKLKLAGEQLARVPGDARTSIFASNKEMLGTYSGLSGKALDDAHAEVIKVNNTKRLKDAKALQQMRRVSTTRSTESSKKGTNRLLTNAGVGAHSFENRWGPIGGIDDQPAMDAFVEGVDAQMLDTMDTLANKGIRVNPDQLIDLMIQEAQATGAMNWNAPDDVDHVDIELIRDNFKTIETRLLGEQEAKPSSNLQAPATPGKRRRVTLN